MQSLESQLWASAVQVAQERGMTFSVPCSRNVKDLVRAGVSVMTRENRLGEDDRDVADANLRVLAEEMVRAATETGETVVRETALVRAKRLCPLWPFG